jgi:uncharacterized membrane protein
MTETTTLSGEKKRDRSGSSAPPRILERNVRALVEHAAEEERSRPASDRIATSIWRFAGTMNFVYLHVIIFGLWAMLDAGWIAGIKNFDPDFTILGTAAAVEAIFLATFVLRAQIQMNDKADLRNHLDLQVSLLAEQETTHILRLVAAMADRMGIEEACDPEIQELLRELKPADVLDRIEVHTDKVEEEIRDAR